MTGNTRRTHRNAPAFKNPETNGAAEKSTNGKTEWNYWNKSGADEKKNGTTEKKKWDRGEEIIGMVGKLIGLLKKEWHFWEKK